MRIFTIRPVSLPLRGRPFLLFLAHLGIIATAARVSAADLDITYNRQIRPVLADKCFLCHGPDQKTRKANMRLDQADSAISKKAIVPGKPDESELIRRITSSDPDQMMPPPKARKTLTDSERKLLRSWISQGAKYEGHWAFIPPQKPEIAPGANAIDFLVHERLQAVGLKPSPEADKRILARRLYFDLVGLPPRPEEVAAFEHDASTNAYRELVEKLLASKHYGERMAIGWLDVARFADTIGYHSDNPRNIWPYRDYVLRAFNENKPFDTFTREQLAGDLLPNCGLEQKVGSAFNRLLLTTEEGGAQPKDYEYRMLTDRVRAVGTVWLGQTLGCTACHDHKFDPPTMRDFYSLGAFFADIKEPIIGRREEGDLVPDKKQETELARLEGEVATVDGDFRSPHPELRAVFVAWQKEQRAAVEREKDWTVLIPSVAKSANGAKLKLQKENSVLAEGKKPNRDTYTLTFTNSPNRLAGLRLETLPHDSLPAKGPGRAANGNFVITHITALVNRNGAQELPLDFKSARASFEQTVEAENNPHKAWEASAVLDDKAGENLGWAILPEIGKPQQLLLELRDVVSVASGDSLTLEIRQNLGNGSHTLGHFRVSACTDHETVSGPLALPPPRDVAELLRAYAQKPTEDQEQKLFEKFKAITPELAGLRQKLADARKAKADFEATIPRCLVTVSTSERRTVHILPRGNFLNEQSGPTVEAALPAYLATAKGDTNEQRLTRLDLANWIVSRQNPLTGRVTMNRLWKQFFGTGLSRVLDDLGTQGEIPPNQPLLDWLACEFMDSGWDIKHMVRLIVSSQTYRQVSTQTPELRGKDPYNRELACQSRWRLEAELVRDEALSLAGLLVPDIGGPSVKPYQPDGYWENLNFPPRTYDSSKSTDQYRRGLYVWWQRSFVHPAMLAFDAPTREECAAERIRSNIPQQALVLLNDPTFVEASRVFATRILKEGGPDAASRITWAWRQVLAREPQTAELETLMRLLKRFEADYAQDNAAAEALLKVGLQPAPEGVAPAELASWANVARVILNLHETITRS